MRRLKGLILVVLASLWAAGAPPALADVTCKDGSTSAGGKGACSHHGGVAASSGAAPSEKAAPAAKPPASAPPASAPPASAATVMCKDGSTSHGGKGACSHHGGMATEGASGAAPAPAQPSRESRSSTPAPAPAPAPPPSTQGRAAPAPASRPSTPTTPQQPGSQPTAKCKDGTMSYSAHHSGACSHHGGVDQWLQAN